MGSGPALVPGASTSLQRQTILDNHRPASPTNAPPAQFFGPHVACHVREGRFLIAGAPMLREQSGKSRALQGGRLSRRRSRILGSGRLGAESVVPRARRDSSRPRLTCAWVAGHTHSHPACRQHLLRSKYHILGRTHPQLMCSIFRLKVLRRLVFNFFGSLQRKVTV